jgi:RimJ/RimL family protein N-acetyltransferase
VNPLRNPEPPLSDEQLLLRPWDEGDLPLLEQASTDEYVAMIEHLPVPFSAEQGRAWVATQHERLDDGRGWAFAIVERGSGEAVGGIGISFRHPPGAAEPGVWVLGEQRNRGLAERATRLLCSWALTTDTGIERIQATVEPWNLASQRVLEKVGFLREGLLRSYAPCRGGRQDVYLYSLLRSDLT